MLISTPTTVPRSLSQMSLLAEVETQAFWHGGRVAVVPLELLGRRAGTAYSYERRILGIGSGIHDGVILLDSALHRLSIAALTDQLTNAVQADLATFRIAGPTPIDLVAGERIAGRTTSVTVARDVQEVLALGATYTEFLDRLGRSTRRNLRNCRHAAAELGLGFDCSTSGPAGGMEELQQLCRSSMPIPSSGRRICGIRNLIDSHSRPFHAYLRSACGRLISACGGVIHNDLALLLYQSNHGAFRSLNPSLCMRSFVIERMINEGARHLAFVGSCNGLLRHSCDRISAAEILIARNSVCARLKTLFCCITDPGCRIARLSTYRRKLMEAPKTTGSLTLAET